MNSDSFLRISALCLGLTALLFAPEVQAADDEESALKSGPSVRRKLLYRSTRFEIQPLLGVTTGDSYMRNAVGGLSLNYFLTNEIGIGVTAGYAPFHPETSLAKNVKKKLAANDDDRLDELRFSYLQWFAGLEFTYVPIFGKFSIMNSVNAAYDIHLIGGVSLMGRGACQASNPKQGCAKTPAPNAELGGSFSPAGTVGAGFRLFVGDAYAINLQVRDHLYQVAESGTGDTESEFKSNVFLSAGFSFFFPQSVKISR